ncbi:hypothetical protein [Aegicerativicinus sediminis]
MKKLSILLIIISILSIESCQKESLTELNIDPNNPANVNIGLTFTAGVDYILYKYGRFTNGTDWDAWAGLLRNNGPVTMAAV